MLSHDSIWAAIDRLAEQHSLTPSGLARRAGLDPTSFNKSKRVGADGRMRWPSTESIAKVLEATGASLDQFMRYVSPEALRGSPLPQGTFPPQASSIPLLGMAQAGQDGFFDDAGLPVGDGWEQTDLPRPRDSLLSLRIVGDSMAPLYRDGDRVLVDRDRTDVRRGDRVVVRTRDGETLAKEIGAISGREVTLVSINPAYPPRTLARTDVAWMARILWVSQ